MANGETVASLDVTLDSIYEVDVSTNITADAYSNKKTYSAGDYVIYAKFLYKCKTTISEPEEFDEEKWDKVKLADEVEALNTEIEGKADVDTVYTKTEVDTALEGKADSDTVYTKTEVDTALSAKADNSNVYTKSEINTALSLKADNSNVYTKSEVYTKTETDTALANKADSSSVYTKDEVYNKTQVDTIINNLPEPMIFKGILGEEGTITDLPSAGSSNEGFTYKVVTAGTYASIVAKVGDVFVSNGSEWVLIPAGDTDSDTWRIIKVNGTTRFGNNISSGAVDFVDGTNIKPTYISNGKKIQFSLSGVYTSSQVDTALEEKADKTDTPIGTKEGTPSIITDGANDMPITALSINATNINQTVLEVEDYSQVPFPIYVTPNVWNGAIGKSVITTNGITYEPQQDGTILVYGNQSSSNGSYFSLNNIFEKWLGDMTGTWWEGFTYTMNCFTPTIISGDEDDWQVAVVGSTHSSSPIIPSEQSPRQYYDICDVGGSGATLNIEGSFSSSKAYNMWIIVAQGTIIPQSNPVIIKPTLIKGSSLASEYIPPMNYAPIKYWNDIQISRQGNGETVSDVANINANIYKGNLNLTEGTGLSSHISITLTENDDWSLYTNQNTKTIFTCRILSIPPVLDFPFEGSAYSEVLQYDTTITPTLDQNALQDNHFYIGQNNIYVRIDSIGAPVEYHDSIGKYDCLEVFKNFLSQIGGLKIVLPNRSSSYPFSPESIPITFTPFDVTTLSTKTVDGTNTFTTDCGNVTYLKYYNKIAKEIIDAGHSTIADLNDTSITVPINGQVLEYDEASGKWKNNNKIKTTTYSGEATSTLYYGTCDVTRVDLGAVELVVITATSVKCNGTISTSTENTPIFTFPQGALAGLDEKVLLAFCKSTNFVFARFRVYEANNQLSIFYGTTEDGWYNASETFIVPKT